MGQGSELSELRQRVEAVSLRFGEVAEDSRRRGERLASLLDQVEKGVVRGRHEIDRLTRTLAEAREENVQILGLLQRLLAMAERVDEPGDRIVLCDLEARVDRLHDQAVSMKPVPDEVAGDEDGPPLELTRMIAEDGEMKDLAPGPAGVVESGAVQDIFKRVSMITGRLRET